MDSISSATTAACGHDDDDDEEEEDIAVVGRAAVESFKVAVAVAVAADGVGVAQANDDDDDNMLFLGLSISSHQPNRKTHVHHALDDDNAMGTRVGLPVINTRSTTHDKRND